LQEIDHARCDDGRLGGRNRPCDYHGIGRRCRGEQEAGAELRRQPAAVERFVASDFIEHNPNLPPGRDGRKGFVTAVQAGFSDYRGEIVELLAEGDRVVMRVQWSGTQDGPFLGLPPSGNKVRFATADFFRIADGKLAEHWDVVDSLPRAIALGLVPPPKTSTVIVPPKSQ
jgi:predicted ester cyclase